MANKKKKVVKKKKIIAKKVIAKKVIAKKIIAKKPVAKPTKKTMKNPVKKTSANKVKTQVVKPIKLTSVPNIDYSKAITPLGDRLVVKVVNSERITQGGLIIPDSAASVATGYLKAKVLAVGTGGKSKKGNLQPLDVKIGDTVLFSEHSGTKVLFNSEDLQIIHETDVMGVVQG